MWIAKNIYSLNCAIKSHIFLIKNKDEYVMIDTGFKTKITKIINELNFINISITSIKKILLTHGDVDHVGNLQSLIKIINPDVYANVNEIPYLAKQKHYSKIKRFFKFLLHTPSFTNIKSLSNDSIGDIEIINTPGHTPGHVCYRYKEYLFCGDLVAVNNNQIFLMKGTMTYNKQQYLQSIKNIDLTNVKFLCPAHGDVIEVEPNWSIFLNKNI